MKGIEKSKSKLREIETLKTLNILANMLVEEIKEIHIRYRKYLKYKSVTTIKWIISGQSPYHKICKIIKKNCNKFFQAYIKRNNVKPNRKTNTWI